MTGTVADRQWFMDHLQSAQDIVDFLAGDGLSLEGALVADIGTGDGIIDLAIARLAKPARITGFDLNQVDTERLLGSARTFGYCDDLPPNLDFEVSGANELPGADCQFDALISWSCFEHVGEPALLAKEMFRVLRPGGILFLQLWPFYFSPHGAHLTDWFPDGYCHLLMEQDDLQNKVVSDPSQSSEWARYKWAEFGTLNRLTLDQLQDSLLEAGFSINKAQLITSAAHLPHGSRHHRLSDLLIGGVMLLASRQSDGTSPLEALAARRPIAEVTPDAPSDAVDLGDRSVGSSVEDIFLKGARLCKSAIRRCRRLARWLSRGLH
jgi:ubiquinone/menaquinone biosynthesis C-methylase UbiE